MLTRTADGKYGDDSELRCDICVFYRPTEDNLLGKCRRHAPVPVSEIAASDKGGDINPGVVVPDVFSDEWCGEGIILPEYIAEREMLSGVIFISP